MPWWNPFSTDANNGKSIAELDAARAELDRRRAARREAEAMFWESEGFQDEADARRQAEQQWQRQHEGNLRREQAAIESETVFDAGVAGWNDAVAERRKQGDALIGGTLKTIFGIVPRWVWLGLAIAGVIYFWPAIRAVLFRRKSA